MRQIGSVSNRDLAERFADYLRAGGTACTIDKTDDAYRLWVHDDDRVAAAKEELPRFLNEPDHQRYLDAKQLAQARLNEDLKRQRAARKRTVNLSDKWSRPVGENCPLTFGLIAISVVVAYFMWYHPRRGDLRIDLLYFSTDRTLGPILQGEVWRLVTPIFMHADWLHLLFNMLWTLQFGMQIEYRKGSAKFLGMVLVIAALSNFAQFYFVGPNFGGMSGVVYGLFGYIWVKQKVEPESGLFVPQQTVIMMLAWYVICILGWISNVANWAHGVGLITGVAIGFSGSFLKPLLRRK